MTLVVLCAAALLVVAYASSAATAVLVQLGTRRLERLASAAQARIYLLAALAPLLVSVVVLMAALSPSFGWIADHCVRAGDPHSHPHICTAHHVADWPALSLMALTVFGGGRFFLLGVQRVSATVLAHRTRRALDAASSVATDADYRVLPFDEAQAFVLGLLRPTLYVTRGLVHDATRSHLAAVMAHERAHKQRLDPLRRFVGGLGLAFHLPGIGGWLSRRLERSHEMSADDAAAEVVGSRERVAEALVAVARLRIDAPARAMAFAGTDLEARVHQLLDDRPRFNAPTTLPIAMATLVGVLLVAASADAVHHAIEMVLGLLAS